MDISVFELLHSSIFILGRLLNIQTLSQAREDSGHRYQELPLIGDWSGEGLDCWTVPLFIFSLGEVPRLRYARSNIVPMILTILIILED